MDPPSPSPPPDTLDVVATTEIEIPEPDYNDSDDDDIVDEAPSCVDSKTEELSVSEAQRVDDEDGDAQLKVEVDQDHDDDDVVQSLDFDGKRAMLEAFSRDLQQLRGSVLVADQDVDLPEPDYSDSDDDRLMDAGVDEEIQSQLIAAKKLVNPCLESKEHAALRRELVFNQRLGVNVLDNKTELRKEMDKRKQRQQRRDDEERDRLSRSTLKLRLEQQANKLNVSERPLASGDNSPAAVSPASVNDGHPAAEFLRVHAKISQQKSAS